MTMTETEELAIRLRRAYNPRTDRDDWSHPAHPAHSRGKWIAVAQAAERVTSTDQTEVAAALHAVYVSDLLEQRDHGWPPRGDAERDRWLAVAAASHVEHRDPTGGE